MNGITPDNGSEERAANSLDRRKISQQSRDELKTAISNVDDPDTQQSLATIFEILTGETIS